ncbi:hypothetical protein MIMGU_mgv1a020121mg [Erythranthe guttata]|uniref:Poly(A) RNA polymerase mitochondrial-like central palm domain-containing protein n=1 Tax=Erythranthe guttata TaxID=4155 RepID=A0A022PVZ1_ERYGU|nr:hypothetical protein MIMGU_mgv1a020121mg [Erythranthe guttata]
MGRFRYINRVAKSYIYLFSGEKAQAKCAARNDWSFRFQIINEIRAIVGSIEVQLWNHLGILHLISLQNGTYISSPGKKPKQSVLQEVLKAFRKKGGFRKLKFIANARVPILKFEGGYNILCDISINNVSGQMKSKLLILDQRDRWALPGPSPT